MSNNEIKPNNALAMIQNTGRAVVTREQTIEYFDWNLFPSLCQRTSSTFAQDRAINLDHMVKGLAGEFAEHIANPVGSVEALDELADVMWYLGQGWLAIVSFAGREVNYVQGFQHYMEYIIHEAIPTFHDFNTNPCAPDDENGCMSEVRLGVFVTIGEACEVAKKAVHYGKYKETSLDALESVYTDVLNYIQCYLEQYHPSVNLDDMAMALFRKLQVRYPGAADMIEANPEGGLTTSFGTDDKDEDELSPFEKLHARDYGIPDAPESPLVDSE